MSSSTPITFLFVLNFFFFANSMFIDVFQNNNYFCTINTQYSTSCANPSLSASFTLDFPSGNLTYQAIPVSRTSFVFQLLTIPNLSNLIFKGNNSITLDATIGSPASWNDENTVTPIDENTYRICDNMQGCCNARETRQGSQIYSCLSSGCTLLLNLNTNVLKLVSPDGLRNVEATIFWNAGYGYNHWNVLNYVNTNPLTFTFFLSK